MWASRDGYEFDEIHTDLWHKKPSREDWSDGRKRWQWKGDGWAGCIWWNPLQLRPNQCVEIEDIVLKRKAKPKRKAVRR